MITALLIRNVVAQWTTPVFESESRRKNTVDRAPETSAVDRVITSGLSGGAGADALRRPTRPVKRDDLVFRCKSCHAAGAG